MNVGYFILGLVSWQLIKMFALVINRAVIERRQKRIIKLVHIVFPEAQKISFISIEASDKRSAMNLERQLREQYDPEPDIPGPIIRDSGKEQ